MIINNTYFKNKIYLPHAKPSITNAVVNAESGINYYIDKYENECLVKCLGYKLAREFQAVLDSTEANGLKVGADTKWDDLLNGKEYVNTDGDTVKWEGIRRKLPLNTTSYNESFLADYVYFFFERGDYITRAGVGNIKVKSKNSTLVSPNDKITRAWNSFIGIVQGDTIQPAIINSTFGLGIDYYGGGQEINMYQFINDTNNLIADTYADFNPKIWTKLNDFGI